jgi:hypothetical protein
MALIESSQVNSGNVALIAALCTAIGTIFGVIITSFIQARTNRLNRESEERKHYRDIVVKAAIEIWKQNLEVAKSQGGHVLPLESVIVAVAKGADVIFDPTTNETNLVERLEKANTFVEIAESCAIERTERYNRLQKEKRSDESGKV